MGVGILRFVCIFLFIASAASSQPPLSSQQRPQVFEGQASHPFRLSYLLFLPSDYEQNPRTRWPLILYLHGGSLRGTDIQSVGTLGLPRKIESDRAFPFIVLSPQCPAGEIWTDVEGLQGLLDHIQTTCRIDPARIYVTGHSMGGRGALYLAYRLPGRFAAVLALSPLSPIAAWGEKLAKMPTWIFHGEADAIARSPRRRSWRAASTERADTHAWRFCPSAITSSSTSMIDPRFTNS